MSTAMTGVVVTAPQSQQRTEPEVCCCGVSTALLVVVILEVIFCVWYLANVILTFTAQDANIASGAIAIIILVLNIMFVAFLYKAYEQKRAGYCKPYIVWKIIQIVIQSIAVILAVVALSAAASVWDNLPDANALKTTLYVSVGLSVVFIGCEIFFVVVAFKAQAHYLLGQPFHNTPIIVNAGAVNYPVVAGVSTVAAPYGQQQPPGGYGYPQPPPAYGAQPFNPGYPKV